MTTSYAKRVCNTKTITITTTVVASCRFDYALEPPADNNNRCTRWNYFSFCTRRTQRDMRDDDDDGHYSSE